MQSPRIVTRPGGSVGDACQVLTDERVREIMSLGTADRNRNDGRQAAFDEVVLEPMPWRAIVLHRKDRAEERKT